MGYLLSSGEATDIALNQLKEQRLRISEKWSKLGLLEGLTGYVNPEITALYECTASWALPEQKNKTIEELLENIQK